VNFDREEEEEEEVVRATSILPIVTTHQHQHPTQSAFDTSDAPHSY
jgi:hypothetical protein